MKMIVTLSKCFAVLTVKVHLIHIKIITTTTTTTTTTKMDGIIKIK
jgi:hypothetical protein